MSGEEMQTSSRRRVVGRGRSGNVTGIGTPHIHGIILQISGGGVIMVVDNDWVEVILDLRKAWRR